MSDVNRREFLVQAAGALGAVAILPAILPAAITLADPLPVAVIGTGRQGRAMLDELQKIAAVRVVAICDTDSRALAQGQRRAAAAKAYASHQELLEKSKDAATIFVATPTHLHKDLVLDLIAAGKNVYCEAPLAHTIEDSRAIATAASKSKVVFAAGLEGRSNPVYKLARTFFRSEAVRDVVAMRAHQFQKTSWRLPASDAARDKLLNWRLDEAVSLGLPGEWGTHQFDVMSWYRDKYPVSVRGSGRLAAHDDGRKVADSVTAELAYADGARLIYESSLGSSFQGKHEVFNGTNATIKLAWSHAWMFKEADAPTQGWEVYANRQQFHNEEGITLIAGATKLAEQGKLKEGVGLPETSLHYALADFIRSVAEGKPVVATAEMGHKATVVGIAAQQAVVEGKTIDLTPEMFKI
jgi:predicted dehydrogenase